MVCLALELVGPWVVLGFSVGMEAFDELLSINVPWSQEFSGVLRIWTCLLLLVFSLIFTVVSRLLLLYSTVDKTSRLKMKSFSTVRDTQRGSQSYIVKRRGRRELEVTRTSNIPQFMDCKGKPRQHIKKQSCVFFFFFYLQRSI